MTGALAHADVIPSPPRFYSRKYAWQDRGMRPCSKTPGGVSRPGGWRSFGEYTFLEDSRYTSQEGRGRTCILRSLRRACAHSISTSFQKPIQWSICFIAARGASYDQAARSLRAASAAIS